jgi:hypothetical protein
MLQSII